MIGKMYVTMMPVILAGILNMCFVKTSLYRKWMLPIDRGKVGKDGKRLLGDNKTWGGFFGMIVFAMISQCVWGVVCDKWLKGWNYIYDYQPNVLFWNLLFGALFGFAYVLFELPNSYLKRRLDIPAGKTVSGKKGKLFFVIDQVDSLFGVGIVLACLYPMPFWQYILYVLLGAVTHIGVNLILYCLKIRKNL